MRDALLVCDERRGSTRVQINEREGHFWLDLDVTIPITREPLHIRHNGQPEIFCDDEWGKRTVTIQFRNRLIGHSYHVAPERQRLFAEFVDRNPERTQS